MYYSPKHTSKNSGLQYKQMSSTTGQNGSRNKIVVSSDQVTMRRCGLRLPTVSSSTRRLPWSSYPKTIWVFLPFWGLAGVAKNVTRVRFRSWQCEFFERTKAFLGWTALILDVCEETIIGTGLRNSFNMSYGVTKSRNINKPNNNQYAVNTNKL